MTITEQIITIGMVILGTMLTRYLAFLLFPTNKKTPALIRYLGDVLPGAVFALLVVYCLRKVDFVGQMHGIPEILAIIITVILHLKWRQMLISIMGGTLTYMLLLSQW